MDSIDVAESWSTAATMMMISKDGKVIEREANLIAD
jgi:hypothetical protein